MLEETGLSVRRKVGDTVECGCRQTYVAVLQSSSSVQIKSEVLGMGEETLRSEASRK